MKDRKDNGQLWNVCILRKPRYIHWPGKLVILSGQNRFNIRFAFVWLKQFFISVEELPSKIRSFSSACRNPQRLLRGNGLNFRLGGETISGETRTMEWRNGRRLDGAFRSHYASHDPRPRSLHSQIKKNQWQCRAAAKWHCTGLVQYNIYITMMMYPTIIFPRLPN